MNIRERPPLRVYDEIITPSGYRYRWGPDEPDARNVPSRRRDSSTIPGGFESADGALQRKPGFNYGDMERLSTHRRYGAGGEVVYEGRLERAPRVSGDQFSITPSSVGWQAHLDDDKSVSFIGRDIDLSNWGPMSRARRVALLATYNGINDGSVAPDAQNSLPALSQTITFSANDKPYTSNLYDAGPGNLISSVYYDSTESGFVGPNANITALLEVNTQDDLAGVGNNTGDVDSGGAATLTATTAARYAAASFYWNGTAASGPAEYMYAWRRLAVYGNHGLTLRGTEPNAGFYDADLIGYAISRWCPFLRYTSQSLTADTTFIIPQAAFRDPTTVSDVVQQSTRFSVRPWAVWENRIFWLYDWGAKGRSWRARVGPAALEETGPQVDRLWNSIMVSYQDVDGSARTVGPPNSGADTEDSVLLDDDPENPANKLGIVRRDMLAMGTGTAASATEVGRRFLAESKRLDSSGRATFNGYVEDDRGVVHPYWAVRAGDDVVFVDAADTSARRIVRAENDHDARTCSIDLDSPPEGLQALLERLQVVLVPLGL